ncbi:hypothetical protein EV1_030442 [Malus domestica]
MSMLGLRRLYVLYLQETGSPIPFHRRSVPPDNRVSIVDHSEKLIKIIAASVGGFMVVVICSFLLWMVCWRSRGGGGEARRSKGVSEDLNPRGPVGTGPFQKGRVRFGSHFEKSKTRPVPSRFIYKQVRSGSFNFGPGPARAHPYTHSQ